jgi:hypothetical protein
MARKKSNKKRVDKAPARRTYPSRLSGNRMFDDLKDMALVAGGVLLGKQVANLVAKGTTTVSGMFGIEGVDGATVENMVRPLATVGIGLAAHQLVKNPMGKKVAIGVCTYGVIDGIQRITGKTYISGLGNAETVVPMAYQALPQYQFPTMGIEDVTPESITAGASDEPTQTITAGIGETVIDITAGFENYDTESVMDGLGGDDEDLAITA